MPLSSDDTLKTEAIIHYGDGDYTLMRQGDYVLCAISGRKIALAELKYWNPRTQEAYAGPAEATEGWKKLNA